MIVYIVLILLVLIFLLLSYRNRGRKVCVGFAYVLIVLIAGLRDNVGTDYSMYKSFFLYSNWLSVFSTNLEPVFTIIAKFTHTVFGSNYWTLFLVYAVITYAFICSNAVENEKNYWLSIYLFMAFGFYTSSLNIIRQWLAIAFIVESTNQFGEKNIKRGIVFYILAALSHFSSLVFLPFLVTAMVIKKDKTRVGIITASILIYTFGSNINDFLKFILGLIPQFNKYIKYLNYAQIETNVFVFPMFCLVTYVMYYIFVVKYGKKEHFSRFNTISLNMVIWGFGISLVGTRIMIFERVQFYSIVYLIYALPAILEQMSKRNRQIVSVCMVILGLAFYIYSLNKNGGEPLPYKFVFLDKSIF